MTRGVGCEVAARETSSLKLEGESTRKERREHGGSRGFLTCKESKLMEEEETQGDRVEAEGKSCDPPRIVAEGQEMWSS